MNTIKPAKHQDLVSENDPDDPLVVNLEIPKKDIIVYTYELHDDGGDEYIFTGKYNTYDVSKYNIQLSGKKLMRYYKCALQNENDRTYSTYGGGNSHVFVFEDREVKVIYLPYRFDNEIYKKCESDSYQIRTGVLGLQEMVEILEEKDLEYEIIGFTKDKIIYAFETEDQISGDLGIQEPRKYMSTYATLDDDSEILFL